MPSSRFLRSILGSGAVLALAVTGVTGTTGQGTTTADASYSADCTYTIGFWKTHPEYWSSTRLQLGAVSYTAGEAGRILDTPVKGNGAVALAHQLIGAKLNVALGADSSTATDAIGQADTLLGGLVIPPIGSGSLKPAITASPTFALTDFNEGVVGPGHCSGLPVQDPPGDGGGGVVTVS